AQPAPVFSTPGDDAPAPQNAAQAPSLGQLGAAPSPARSAAARALPGAARAANAPADAPAGRQASGPTAALRSFAGASDPGHLWDGARAPRPDADPAGTRWDAARLSALAAADSARSSSEPGPGIERPALPAPASMPRSTAAGRARDALAYYRLASSSLFWYTFPRLIERWNELRDSLAASSSSSHAVKDFRGFFIAHRVLGSTGSYSPMGFRVATNGVVSEEAWHIFNRYFSVGPEATAAFARLVDRAQRFNPNRRSTQFRKVVFHALRAASVLPPESVAAFLDSIATEDAARALADFQATRQNEILEALDETAREAILDANRELPAGQKVVAAVLLGSFANGAAGPDSDLDLQVVSEDGSAAAATAFNRRVKALWKARGGTSPISGFQYSLRYSRDLVEMVHPESYRVITPYAGVRDALSRRPDEATRTISRTPSWWGRAFQAAYTALLHVILALYEAWKPQRLGAV
ncbi:MAG TPA: nucleotidyltransferase domain-containing protein, partial [Elusimicrobiota bacterium]|nr:nucleotidyltransferase domain-containing protein [Elusimicrobiota bacterium]